MVRDAGRRRGPGHGILDRLLHYYHVLQIDGRSFRLRDMEQQLAQDR